jgi:hypothetical protein
MAVVADKPLGVSPLTGDPPSSQSHDIISTIEVPQDDVKQAKLLSGFPVLQPHVLAALEITDDEKTYAPFMAAYRVRGKVYGYNGSGYDLVKRTPMADACYSNITVAQYIELLQLKAWLPHLPAGILEKVVTVVHLQDIGHPCPLDAYVAMLGSSPARCRTPWLIPERVSVLLEEWAQDERYIFREMLMTPEELCPFKLLSGYVPRLVTIAKRGEVLTRSNCWLPPTLSPNGATDCGNTTVPPGQWPGVYAILAAQATVVSRKKTAGRGRGRGGRGGRRGGE